MTLDSFISFLSQTLQEAAEKAAAKEAKAKEAAAKKEEAAKAKAEVCQLCLCCWCDYTIHSFLEERTILTLQLHILIFTSTTQSIFYLQADAKKAEENAAKAAAKDKVRH